MCEGRQRGRRADKIEEGGDLHKGHLDFSVGMVVRGERRQSLRQPALHMSQKSISSSSQGLWHTWHWVCSGVGLPLGLEVGGMGAGAGEG